MKEENKKAAITSIIKIGGALYLKITGKICKDELAELERARAEVEQTISEQRFIFDFSGMEDAIIPAVRILIQMQCEARKRGAVYVLSPDSNMLSKLQDAGAVRESELFKNKDQLVRALRTEPIRVV